MTIKKPVSAGKSRAGFRSLSDMTTGVLDPVLRKRAGINLSLVQSWEDIVGTLVGSQSRPLKILWPRRAHEDDPFQPATLVIGCTGAMAMRIQHSTGEIISRVNSFLGFAAVARIKIEQRTIAQPVKRQPIRPVLLSAPVEKKIERATAAIDDEDLRASLIRLGRHIQAEKVSGRAKAKK